jgi:hypothetical protein
VLSTIGAAGEALATAIFVIRARFMRPHGPQAAPERACLGHQFSRIFDLMTYYIVQCKIIATQKWLEFAEKLTP